MSSDPVRIGPYDIVAPLGEGGMGVVYRAVHSIDGVEVALKTVRVRDESQFAAIRREIYALSRLRHPGVVQVVDSGVHNSRPWYAMELLEGRTLRSEFAAEPPASPEALVKRLTLLKRLCGPLAYMHGEGVVHCDLKPDNVFVNAECRPVLVDFGVAARFTGGAGREALDIASEGAGTIAYMAPEQIQGEPVDARADLYALGCMLFEAATGRRVFERARPVEVAWAHLTDEPPPPSSFGDGIPPELDELVSKLLAKRPAERIGYADDVARALGDLCRDAVDDGPRAKSYLYRPTFTGRAAGLDTVRAHVACLDSGFGGLVAVGGESGIGKTRLVAEAGRYAQAQGMRVVAGECGAIGDAGAAPLSGLRPLLDAVSDWCRQGGPAETAHVVGLAGPVLAQYDPAFHDLSVGGGALPPLVDLAPDAARLRLFRALADVVARFAQSCRPVVAIIDDAQWADELTIGFLEHMARAGDANRVRALFIITHRSDETGPDLARLLECGGVDRVGLDRLDESDVANIVGGMLALTPPPRVFSRYLARQSEGNPFFVAEYLRAAVDIGLLWRDDAGEWQIAETGSSVSHSNIVPLPGSLRELVGRRIDDLPDDARKLVTAAAVLGRETDTRLVLRVAGIDDEQSREPIRNLIARHVVTETAHGRLRFVHDKLREVAYGRIDESDRARLHETAAALIVADGGDAANEFAASLGYHWQMAGRWDEARASYLKAARSARRRYALGESDRLYRAYLALDGGPAGESAVATLELAHDVLRLRGRSAEAVRLAAEVVRSARDSGELALEAEAHRKLGILYWEVARMDDARAEFETALAIGRRLGDDTFIGVTSGNLGNVHLQQGRFEDALVCYAAAIEAHRRMGDRSGEGVKLGNVAIVHYERGEFDRAVDLYKESIAVARETGNRAIEAKMIGNLGLLESDRDNLDAAEPLLEAALALSREIGDRREQGIILGNIAVQHLRRARFDEALAANAEARAIASEALNARSEGILLSFKASVERLLGRVEDAQTTIDRSVRLIDDAGDALQLANALCEYGMVSLARGLPARDALERARAIARDLAARPESDLARNIGQLARACDAAENGEALFRGQRFEDLSPDIVAWIERTGSLPGAS